MDIVVLGGALWLCVMPILAVLGMALVVGLFVFALYDVDWWHRTCIETDAERFARVFREARYRNASGDIGL